ncbi:MAG: hypothetical protein GVY07_08410 [Bacteroidetes bacterium]|jgi:hypothetical protein|nr:hypothetical protein [Bacteroidota bacterium]
MKRFYKQSHSIALLLMASTISMVACSTTGMQRSEDLQSSLETVDSDIKLTVVQLEAIGSSLDELTRPGQSDVKKAFDVFSKNVKKSGDLEKAFSKDSDRMTSDIKTYLDAWDKNKNQYDNAELQQSSNERRAALGRTYDRIAQTKLGVKEAYKTYVSDVTEIQKYLSNDLTSQGISSISSLSDKTVRNGALLKTEMGKFQSAIESARAEMEKSGIAMN